MFSRILTKLIDEAILPAVLLLATKVISTVAIIKYFDIPLAEETNYFTIYFSNHSDYLLVNSYTSLLMVAVMFLGALGFLVKSRFFHDTHISPATATKVAGLGLGRFIRTSMDLFSEGSIWLSYSFLLSLLLAVELYFKSIYPFVFAVSLGCTIFLALILISDVEREVKRGYV